MAGCGWGKQVGSNVGIANDCLANGASTVQVSFGRQIFSAIFFLFFLGGRLKGAAAYGQLGNELGSININQFIINVMSLSQSI